MSKLVLVRNSDLSILGLVEQAPPENSYAYPFLAVVMPEEFENTSFYAILENGQIKFEKFPEEIPID